MRAFEVFLEAKFSNDLPRCRRPPTAAAAALPIAPYMEFYNARFVEADKNYGAAHTARNLTIRPGDFLLPVEARSFTFEYSTPESMQLEYYSDHYASDDGYSQRSRTPEASAMKRICTGNDRRKPTLRFNIMRPVKNSESVVEDVWRLILGWTSPEFLLEAKTVNKEWNSLLEEDAIWQQARINEYGGDMPSPPRNMTERRYADLLAGKGCQNRSCARVKTNKVYWAFQLRLCDECFRQKTVRGDAIRHNSAGLIDEQNLLDLLPAGVVFSGKYRHSRQYNSETKSWSEGGDKILYLKSDIDLIEREYSQHVKNGMSGPEIASWKAERMEVARNLMDHAGEIEKWEKECQEEIPRHREDRKAFFEAQAEALSPSMTKEVLHKMQAFQTSLDSRRPPTAKGWKILREKILPYRSQAEQLVEWERQSHSFEHNNKPEITLFLKLHAHRTGRGQSQRTLRKEQNFVMEFGEQELQRCKRSRVADEDLVLVCLQNVFEGYARLSHKPEGLNANGKVGEYVLTLDDARLIVEEILEPEVNDDPRRKVVALEGFKCKGCTRADCTKRYNFQNAFRHIYSRHAQSVGENYHFSYFAKPHPSFSHEVPFRFAWYTILWPRNFPLAASHHEIRRDVDWSPDDFSPYQQLRPVGTVSAFEGRTARPAGYPSQDLKCNLVYAARRLRNTTLESRLQTKIVLKYALDRYSQLSIESPPFKAFAESVGEMRDVNPTLDMRHRCGFCAKQAQLVKGARFVRHPVEFHHLLAHWKSRHYDLDWAVEMMDLPNDCEVLDDIQRSDEKLRQEKRSIRACEEAKKLVAKKKPNAKAKVTLGMEFGMDAFDSLFSTDQ